MAARDYRGVVDVDVVSWPSGHGAYNVITPDAISEAFGGIAQVMQYVMGRGLAAILWVGVSMAVLLALWAMWRRHGG